MHAFIYKLLAQWQGINEPANFHIRAYCCFLLKLLDGFNCRGFKDCKVSCLQIPHCFLVSTANHSITELNYKNLLGPGTSGRHEPAPVAPGFKSVFMKTVSLLSLQYKKNHKCEL